MDAAFDNLFEDHRLRQHSCTRRVSMEKPLTEPEFACAVSDALPKLIAVARRLAGDEEIAAEAVQNALLKASKSWRRFRGQSHVHTWLTRIVIHAVRDAIDANRRRRQRSPLLSQGDPHRAGEDIVDPSKGPSQKLLDQELRNTLQVAVLELPDRQREVFGLMVWQNLSAREVGQLLEISPQTVHANLHAARKRLRELLAHLNNDKGGTT